MKLLRGVGADLSAFAHFMGGARTPAKAEDKPADPNAEMPEEEKAEGEDKPEDQPTAEAAPEEEKAEGDEPDCEEETPAEARAAERARCRAIFAAPAAAGNVALAAHLAFDTDLTAEQAIGALALGGKSGGGLAARMQSAPNPTLGAGNPAKPDAGSPDALAAQIIAAARTARGQKA